MRRSIVPLSLLLAAAVICVLAIAGSAGAASRAPRIACQTAAAQAVTCCPLPPKPDSSDAQPICCNPTTCCPNTASCCQTAACCPSGTTPCCTPTPCTGSLTIASSPNPSLAGRKVVISGAFVGSTASGAEVALWRERAGESSFHQVAQTMTDSAGKYLFTLRRGKVMADQAWYVSSNGVRSATLQQHVAALVGLSSSVRSTPVGRAVVLRGQVTPSHAGQTVLIEQSRGGAWHVIARARLGKSSTYGIAHRFSQPGTVRLRTVLRRDARNDKSLSRTLALTVKP